VSFGLAETEVMSDPFGQIAPSSIPQPKRRLRRNLRVAAVVAASLAVPYSGVSLLAADFLTAGDHTNVTRQQLDAIAPGSRPVAIRMSDGAVLNSTLFHTGKPSGRLAIFVHGWKSTRIKDTGFPQLTRAFLDAGYNVLLAGQRENSGRTTWGKREPGDIAQIVTAMGRFGFSPSEIALYGDSQGASDILLALKTREVRSVGAIVVDSPYANARDEVASAISGATHLPGGVAGVLTWGGTELADSMYGSGFSGTQPIDVVRQHPYPALVIAGSSDDVVPLSNSRSLVQASGGLMRLEIFVGAGHDAAVAKNWSRYSQLVLSYVGNRMKAVDGPPVSSSRRRSGAPASRSKRSNAGYSRYQGPPRRLLH
jgi:pimeloyl-ACP methyl ester carboxylesterase